MKFSAFQTCTKQSPVLRCDVYTRHWAVWRSSTWAEVLAHVRTKQMKASEIIMAHLASPARLTLSINADRANTMFRPCQVLTRKPTPRELFFLIHNRTRPHKSASLTISPAKSTLFSSPGGKRNPRDPGLVVPDPNQQRSDPNSGTRAPRVRVPIGARPRHVSA